MDSRASTGSALRDETRVGGRTATRNSSASSTKILGFTLQVTWSHRGINAGHRQCGVYLAERVLKDTAYLDGEVKEVKEKEMPLIKTRQIHTDLGLNTGPTISQPCDLSKSLNAPETLWLISYIGSDTLGLLHSDSRIAGIKGIGTRLGTQVLKVDINLHSYSDLNVWR